jgi:hypothetical protein
VAQASETLEVNSEPPLINPEDANTSTTLNAPGIPGKSFTQTGLGALTYYHISPNWVARRWAWVAIAARA